MNRVFATLRLVGDKNAKPPIYTDGALLLLHQPMKDASPARGVYYGGEWTLPLFEGEAPATAWELDGAAIGYRMPIEYAAGARASVSEPDRHKQMYLEIPPELFPDGDVTLTFTAALPGMDYLGNGQYIRQYDGYSENWSYLLRTPNFGIYTKHQKKTAELADGKPIPVTAFYHCYNGNGEWNNPSQEERLCLGDEPLFKSLDRPCTYEYSIKDLGNGTVSLRVRIVDYAGKVLFDMEGGRPKPSGRGQIFRFAIDVPVRLYSFAIYPYVLSNAQRARNRFATLMEAHGIDTEGLTDLSEKQQDALISALTTLSFTEDARGVQEKYFAALAAVKETL